MASKSLYMLIPFFVGLCIVLQGALNRRLAEQWGLGWTILWTSVLVIILSGVLVMMNPSVPRPNFAEFRWWYLIPGLCGFAIIVLVPVAISKIGAMSTFLILVSSQIVFSAVWDAWAEGIAVSGPRVAGAALAVLGSWLASR